MIKKTSKTDSSYFIFRLGNEFFSIESHYVLNIINNCHIHKIEDTPSYILGVTNIKGMNIAVINLMDKLKVSASVNLKQSNTLILNLHLNEDSLILGTVVSSVDGEINYPKSKILPIQGLFNLSRKDYIKGIIKKENNIIYLINIRKIFLEEELFIIKKTIL